MKRLNADVVIIGGGTAGMAATVAAAEKGASVIALEKGATTGGTGNMGWGLLAVESRLQRANQIGLTRENAFKIFMDYTHWRVNARLVKAYIDKSASTIDWLEQMGVEFVDPAAYFAGSNFTWHRVKNSDGSTGPGAVATMIKVMTDRAQELGAKIMLQTSAKKILKEGGRVVGVMAEDRSGEDIRVDAKAVIVATGGFGNNPEMVKKYAGYDMDRDIFPFRIPGLFGEGIRMAWETGAGSEGMNMEIMYGMPDLGADGPLGGPPAVFVFRQPNLVVNLHGERFMDEGIMGNTTFTGNAIARQKNRIAFNIVDAGIIEYFKANEFDIIKVIDPGLKIDDFEADIKVIRSEGNTHIFDADSLEGLASKTGINSAGLLRTVAEYNKACETGRDELFQKNPRYLRPVKKPKFYAGRLFPSAYGSLGGIKINYRTEVVTKDEDVIPGLFAAGTDACAIYGDSYVFVLPGNTMGFAVNSGRIAGENAVEYARTIAK
jgi:fumarate reductase flavoprotein subunit